MKGTIDSVSREAAGWDIVDDKTDVDVTVAVLAPRRLVFDLIRVFQNRWRRQSRQRTSRVVAWLRTFWRTS
jgi:hypothetical protein